MAKITLVKRQAVEQIDRYFSGTLSAQDLHAWALAHPTGSDYIPTKRELKERTR